MPTLAPERADEVISRWLEGIDPIDGWENPAGPLFLGGDYAEHEITMTGGGAGGSVVMTGCGWCSGSVCNGMQVHCF